MKPFYILLLLTVWVNTISAQSTTPDILDTNYRRPYLLIDGKKADPLSLMLLDKAQIKMLNVLSPEKATKYGREETKFGAVEVTLNRDSKVLYLNDLLVLYHIRSDASKLPLIIAFGAFKDKLYAKHPDLIFASEGKVFSLGVSLDYYNKDPKLVISKFIYGKDKPTKFDRDIDSLNNVFQEEADRRAPKGGGIRIK